MRVVTLAGTETGTFIVVVAAGAFFVGRGRDWGPAALMVVAWGGPQLVDRFAKPLVGRVRPSVLLAHPDVEHGGAFPSAHVAEAVAVWGGVAVLAAAGRSPRVRAWLALAVAAIVVGVSVSRIYLGFHWFSDVVAGAALGGMWLSLVAAAMIWFGVPPERSAARVGERVRVDDGA